MSFFQHIADLFESLFKSSSPEVHAKQEIKKIETELKAHQPVVYKNGLIQPTIAEAFKQLCIHTAPIEKILSNTLCTDDFQRNARFADMLVETGFMGDKRDLRLSLTYEARKEEIFLSPNPIKVYEMQHRNFEKLMRELSNPEFKQIDAVCSQLDNLADICRFNYASAITPFDPSFNAGIPEAPSNFTPLPPDTLKNVFQDFYYITAKFTITTAVARALSALAEQWHGQRLSEKENKELIGHLKKITTIIHKILNAQTLTEFLAVSTKNPTIQAEFSTYPKKVVAQYEERLKKQFQADEERIKVEQQDDTILSEINTLFNGASLISLQGYNMEMNNFLQENATLSFTWIIPLQILTTFFTVYYNEGIRALVETLVIEGFFDNPTNKSDFSANVYYCNETINRLKEFEAMFSKGGEFDQNLISGYVRDSHKDEDFLKKLSALIKNANAKAKELIQTETSNFFSLTMKFNTILTESKKPKAEYITNIKMLFSSARSKDAAAELERTFPYWKIFLEIMKNYAIIGDIEKQVP